MAWVALFSLSLHALAYLRARLLAWLAYLGFPLAFRIPTLHHLAHHSLHTLAYLFARMLACHLLARLLTWLSLLGPSLTLPNPTLPHHIHHTRTAAHPPAWSWLTSFS